MIGRTSYGRMRPTLADQCFKDQASVGGSGDLSTVLNRISLAGRMICNEVLHAGLLGNLGKTGDTNVQGEEVKRLDVISNQIMIDMFEPIEAVGAIASEEMEEPHWYSRDGVGSKYVLLHDPIDGSGNVDIDGSMGTIFSVHRRIHPERPATREDFLQKGSKQVAAGYLLYGPSTVFVYSAGGEVNGFNLDRKVGAFFLTRPGIRFPSGGGAYAVNESNESKWTPEVQRLVEAFRMGETACGKRSARYVGALVADFHRTLIQGGIYMYPGEVERPKGKLRLMFEGAPLAFIARQAGGRATDGEREILDLEPTELHQRMPLFIGNKPDVDEVMRRLGKG
jgi:fructose-1,6-bisphosphatase I